MVPPLHRFVCYSSGARLSERARPAAALAGCSPNDTRSATIATLGSGGDANYLLVTSHWTGQGVIVARSDTSRRLQYIPQIEAAALSCVAASETADHFVVGDVNGRVLVWRCSPYAKQPPAALKFSRTAPPVLPTASFEGGTYVNMMPKSRVVPGACCSVAMTMNVCVF